MAVQGRTGIFPHRIDKTTDANASVDYEHREVHAGDAYYRTEIFTINAAATAGFLIQTPATTKWSHLYFTIEGQGLILVELYEGATGTVEASNQYNRNRNYADANATLQVSTSAAAGGTLIWNWSSGTAGAPSRTPSLVRQSLELVLKQNTKYRLLLTSGLASNRTSCYLTWYEHTNIE